MESGWICPGIPQQAALKITDQIDFEDLNGFLSWSSLNSGENSDVRLLIPSVFEANLLWTNYANGHFTPDVLFSFVKWSPVFERTNIFAVRAWCRIATLFLLCNICLRSGRCNTHLRSQMKCLCGGSVFGLLIAWNKIFANSPSSHPELILSKFSMDRKWVADFLSIFFFHKTNTNCFQLFKI